jgi:hypothetical protein
MGLRFPLKEEIILITIGGDILCSIEYAGKSVLKLKNVQRKIHTDEGYSFYSEVDEEEEFTFINREDVIGYKKLKVKKSKAPQTSNVLQLTKFKKRDI